MTAPAVRVEVEVRSDTDHLQQVFTGLHLLAARGSIALTQRVQGSARARTDVPRHLSDAHRYRLRVIVDGRFRVVYDLHDSHEVDEQALADADAYFKRSYIRSVAEQVVGGDRVHPLGLNYLVLPDGLDLRHLARARFHGGSERLRVMAKAAAIDRLVPAIGYVPRLRDLEAEPDWSTPARVLFMARVWEPGSADPPEKRAQVEQINEMRAACIRLLRAELGDRFTGGFQHTPMATRDFRDCLLPDPAASAKGRYLSTLKAHQVCVATMGLHGSNGWKLGEYVAHARAIVTERLVHEVPGGFAAGVHHVEFDTPEACLAAVTSLLDDPDRRRLMMMANWRFYRAHGRPDALVLNSLATVFATAADRQGMG